MTTAPETLDIRDPVRLSAGRSLMLVVHGIQHRLFRAGVTVTIITLAVAFLAYVVTDGLMAHRLRDIVRQRLASRDLFAGWISRLSTPMTGEALSRALTARGLSASRRKELMNWGGIDEGTLRRLVAGAFKEREALAFFSGLSEGALRAAVGRTRGRQILAGLGDDAMVDALDARLRGVGNPLPGRLDDFRRSVSEWRALAPAREAILSGQARAVEKVRGALGGRRLLAALREQEPEFTATLGTAGFVLNALEAGTLRAEARHADSVPVVERWLSNVTLRQRLATQLRCRRVTDLDAGLLISKCARPDEAAAIDGLVRKAAEPGVGSVDQLVDLARREIELRRLAAAEAVLESGPAGGGLAGLPGRTLWLIAVSLLVCTVGVANAMLMSVTERFREIATMKCLGATNGFIMNTFVMESALQGASGGIAGALIGIALGVALGAVRYGAISQSCLSPGLLAGVCAAAIAVGVATSICAALYPSRVAARLAPMEAMRIE